MFLIMSVNPNELFQTDTFKQQKKLSGTEQQIFQLGVV